MDADESQGLHGGQGSVAGKFVDSLNAPVIVLVRDVVQLGLSLEGVTVSDTELVVHDCKYHVYNDLVCCCWLEVAIVVDSGELTERNKALGHNPSRIPGIDNKTAFTRARYVGLWSSGTNAPTIQKYHSE